jgi:hypothetical protein
MRFFLIRKNVAALLRSAVGGRRFIEAPLQSGDAVDKSNNLPSTQGIALLELVLATAILGIAMVTLGMAIGNCIRGFVAARNLQAVLEVSQQRMAEWKVLSMTEPIKAETSEGEAVAHQRKFTWSHEIQATDDPEIFKSLLTVGWNEERAEQQRIFVTLVSAAKKK